MLQFFLNPWMLAGLAGVALPIIAHLLVRRRYDVVDWGAMQFLQPGLRTRRRLQLQDFLLLFVRIVLITLVAFALARPWIQSGLFAGYQSSGSRDVVLVIDSSNSMARPDGISTVHQTALRRATEFLSTLSHDDTVMVVDARDVPVAAIDSPQSDLTAVAESIGKIDPPGGFGNLRLACERAVSLLAQASQRRRDIVVFTDRQRSSWSPDDTTLWSQFTDQLNLSSIKPRIWIVDCGHSLTPPANRITVGRLTVEPENAVSGIPVNVRTTLTNHSSQAVTVPLSFEVQGQRLAEHNSTVSVAANGEASVDISHRFETQGTTRLSLVADVPADELQIDNRSHAVVVTRPPINVLLVESSDSLDRSQHHSYFIQIALTPPPGISTWIRSQVIRAEELQANDVATADVVILPDVVSLPDDAPTWLEQAVRSGTGLLITTGAHTSPEFFSHAYVDSGLLPNTAMVSQESVDPDAAIPVRVLPSSLQADWLRPFQIRPETSLLQTVFHRWWDVTTHSDTDGKASSQILMRLTNHIPVLFFRQHRKGRVLLLATSLDNQWNNLPGRPDFVSFLYEAVFQLTSRRTDRNILPGEPFAAPIKSTGQKDLVVRLPAGRNDTARLRTATRGASWEADQTANSPEPQFVVRYDKTFVPGYYEIRNKQEDSRVDAFCVDYDRSEDTNEQLTKADRLFLEQDGRLSFRNSVGAAQQQMYGNESTTEMWALLLYLFLGLLVLESWMTRRLVLQRHGDSGNALQS